MLARSLMAVRSPTVCRLPLLKSTSRHFGMASLRSPGAPMHTRQPTFGHHHATTRRHPIPQSAVGIFESGIASQTFTSARWHFRRANNYGIQLKPHLDTKQIVIMFDKIDYVIFSMEQTASNESMPFVPDIGVCNCDVDLEFGNDDRTEEDECHQLLACLPPGRPDIVEQISRLPEVDRIELQRTVSHLCNEGAREPDKCEEGLDSPCSHKSLELQSFAQDHVVGKIYRKVEKMRYRSHVRRAHKRDPCSPGLEAATELLIHVSRIERPDLEWWLLFVDLSGSWDLATAKRDILLLYNKLDAETSKMEMWAVKDPKHPSALQHLFVGDTKQNFRFENSKDDCEWLRCFIMIRTLDEDHDAVYEVLSFCGFVDLIRSGNDKGDGW